MRKLVTFRTVVEIRSIEGADLIELALLDGWQCVTKKGDFKEGDVGIYLEVDSFLKIRPEFEFLRANSYRKMGEEEGFRLRTVRLRGALSQGLLLPLSMFGLKGDEEDPAAILGVKLYEPPIPAQLSGIAKGLFPSFIPKSDQERVQNLTGKLWGTDTDADGAEVTKELPAAKKRTYEVSEKLDGSSLTCYNYEDNFGVCSRNLELVEDAENSFWKIANKYNLKEKLVGTNKAIQAEFVGEAVQANPYKLRGQDMYIFDVWDITKQVYLSPEERRVFLAEKVPELKTVPILARNYELPDDLPSLLAYVQGTSVLNNKVAREGCVFKEEGEVTHTRFSFKGISNAYLLKQKD